MNVITLGRRRIYAQFVEKVFNGPIIWLCTHVSIRVKNLMPTHCGKAFAQGNDLKAHVRRHTGERYNCDICGEGFIQGYHLTQHKRAAHGIESTSHIRRVEKLPLLSQQTNAVNNVKAKSAAVPTATSPTPSHIEKNAAVNTTLGPEALLQTVTPQIHEGEFNRQMPPLLPIGDPLALFPNYRIN